MLDSFPGKSAARAWKTQALLESSWKKKSQLLLPLTAGEGGVVIFTQFLRTQAALAEELKTAQVPTWVINGQTPAPARQPMTEEFRRHGGALLLTHSGTEGRNLQFCHRLVNFDLPWNPMEIEQRIGRLHRLGQQHPVRIYNLVQSKTLQEYLLQILQEKLNLFELVVGETGLILGDGSGGDEFAEGCSGAGGTQRARLPSRCNRWERTRHRPFGTNQSNSLMKLSSRIMNRFDDFIVGSRRICRQDTGATL